MKEKTLGGAGDDGDEVEPKTAVEGGIGETGFAAGRRESKIPRSSATRAMIREGSWVVLRILVDLFEEGEDEEQMQGRRVYSAKVVHRHPVEISRETASQYCSAATLLRSPLK